MAASCDVTKCQGCQASSLSGRSPKRAPLDDTGQGPVDLFGSKIDMQPFSHFP